jgi:hypothetical protein
METKTCCRCNEVKPLTDYYKHGGACKVCRCKRMRELYPFRPPEQVEAKRQRGKAYKINNRDRVNERAREDNKKPYAKAWRKEYLEKNRVFLRERYREYYKNNRSAIVEYQKNWLHQNPEKWSQYYEAYIAKPEKREAMVAKAQRDREELSLVYIKTLLGGGKLEGIPAELFEAKRIQVQIRRAIKNMTPS